MSEGRAHRAEAGDVRVAVLASGSGTNLQALLDRFHSDASGEPVRVALVVASRPGIGALERAERAGVPTTVLESTDPEGERLREELRSVSAELVVLAGYLRLVPAPVVRAFRGRMVNIHPALLPAFGGEGMYGVGVHRAVLERGARVTGATVHFVDEAYDEGPIIAQWPVPVLEDDDPQRLAARVLQVEHRLLPEVVAALAAGDVRLDDEGRVRWERPWFGAEHFELSGAHGLPARSGGDSVRNG